MTRYVVLVASLIIVLALIVGCGGGGGGGTTPTPTKFVMTGVVKDVSSGSAVVGAKVKVATSETTTDSQGSFRLEMSVAPTAESYSVDGRSATPTPGYFDFWARADGEVQNAKCIRLELPLTNPTNLGTIYLMNADNPPPFPPACE